MNLDELVCDDELVARISERYTPEPTMGCWLWTGPLKRKNYGVVYRGPRGSKGREQFAHRVFYRLHVGPIPPGLTLDHLCRNHVCVNPAHLEPVTIGENVLRGETRTAANAKKTACHLGHVYAEVGVYVTPSGRRNCMECRRMADRKRYARQA